MQGYPGIAPFMTWVTGFPFATGTGLWPTPLVVTGGDDRNAVNLMAACEALTSRTNTLARRTINFVDGGTYTVGGQVNFTGVAAWHFACPVGLTGQSFIAGGGTLNVGQSLLGVGHVVFDASGFAAGTKATWNNGASAEWWTGATLLMASSAGTATFSNTVEFHGSVSLGGATELGGNTTQTGPLIKSGAGGYEGLREPVRVADGDSVYLRITDADVVVFDPILQSGPMYTSSQLFLVPPGNSPAWAHSHGYSAGDQCEANGNQYLCVATAPGTSAATGTGPSGTGTFITDGTTRWAYVAPVWAGPVPAVYRFTVRQTTAITSSVNTTSAYVMANPGGVQLVKFGTNVVTTAVSALRPAAVVVEWSATAGYSFVSVYDPNSVVH